MAYGIEVPTSSGMANLADLPVMRRIATRDVSFTGTTKAGTEVFSVSGHADFNNGRPYNIIAVAGYKSGTKGTSFQVACAPNINTRTGALPATISVEYSVRRQSSVGTLTIQIDLYLLET